jgi:hypothetical protein
MFEPLFCGDGRIQGPVCDMVWIEDAASQIEETRLYGAWNQARGEINHLHSTVWNFAE